MSAYGRPAISLSAAAEFIPGSVASCSFVAALGSSIPPLVAMLPLVAASVVMTAEAESRGATPTAVAVLVESEDLASLSVLHAATAATAARAVRRRRVEL